MDYHLSIKNIFLHLWPLIILGAVLSVQKYQVKFHDKFQSVTLDAKAIAVFDKLYQGIAIALDSNLIFTNATFDVLLDENANFIDKKLRIET